jgi:hypothetical protein
VGAHTHIERQEKRVSLVDDYHDRARSIPGLNTQSLPHHTVSVKLNSWEPSAHLARNQLILLNYKADPL